MRHDDRQLGKPEFIFKDTQANINLITGSNMEGEVAYATDTGLLGHCIGNNWVWEREVLNADRTYYVATGGNDSNNGLTSGGAFLTIQRAIDVVASIDMSIYNVTIQIANGTYTSTTVILKSCIGSGAVYITGNETTPANVNISVSTGYVFSATLVNTVYYLRGMKLSTTADGGILINGSFIYIRKLNFAIGGNHIRTTNNGHCESDGDYEITAGGVSHYSSGKGGNIVMFNVYTLTGTPNFTTSFAYADTGGTYVGSGAGGSYVGSATGKRYSAVLNSVINTNGGGANYFPGNSAGSTATGGQYG